MGQHYTNVPPAGQYEMGSRLGLLSRRSGAVAAWADTRNSLVPGTAQDLFATTVFHHKPAEHPAPDVSGRARAVPEVEVDMSEHRFDYDADVPAGRVVFRARNTGTDLHRLDLYALPEDLPPIDVQLRGSQRRRVTSIANVATRPPGRQGSFAVDLVAGTRYALVCFVRDADGRTHAVKGMNSEFRAGGPRAKP